MTPPANPPYPAQIEIDYPPKLSRLLLFVKWLLVIPHYIAVVILGIIAYVAIAVSWFAVLITGRYPEGLFNFVSGVIRYGHRMSAYGFLFMTDAYPPFSLADDPAYPVRVSIVHPDRVPRWQPLVGWLLAIPVYIVAYVLTLVAFILAFFAWFAILITGRYPRGMFDMITIALRWQLRVTTYMLWMNPQYPPFVWA